MGLAGAKNRRKISKDPNNTKWTRNTESFGQKMLRAQGWEPGQYLGAKGAAHAEFHSAASASHIRVALKDDNLGLGAKRNQSNECTGLDVFKDLLGRLNGKSEEVIEHEKKAREDVKISLYVERKFGRMRFVSGGLLVGDQIRELLAAKESAQQSQESQTDDARDAQEKSKKEKKSKKRKAGEDNEVGSDKATAKAEKKRRKKDRSSKDGRKTVEARESSGFATTDTEEGAAQQPDSEAPAAVDAEASKVKSKKKDKKNKKDRSDAAVEVPEVVEKPTKKKDRRKVEDESTPSSEAEVPSISSRHLARRRFIAQKRRAVMDQQALKQIFMIKA